MEYKLAFMILLLASLGVGLLARNFIRSANASIEAKSQEDWVAGLTNQIAQQARQIAEQQERLNQQEETIARQERIIASLKK